MRNKYASITAFLVLAFFFILNPLIAKEVRKVWSLDVYNDSASIDVNLFNGGKKFPLKDLLIKRVTDNQGLFVPLEDWNPFDPYSKRAQVARLSIGEDGTINGQDGATLDFDEILEIRKIIETENERYIGLIYSKDGTVGAAVKKGKKFYADEAKSAATIFDKDGNVILAKGLEDFSIWDLYLTPDGKYLVYLKRIVESLNIVSHTVIMDTRTGVEKRLDNIPHGVRYYSSDGKRMLIVSAKGRAYFFDTSDHLNPIKLWEYHTDGDIPLLGSVCDDGSLVAIQVMEKENSKSGKSFSRNVVVLTGKGEKIESSEGYGTPSDEMLGLLWADKYLFVGYQGSNYPRSWSLATTGKIEVYDFSGTNAGENLL